MKPQIALAFVVATAPALAFAQTTGVSNPPDDSVQNLPPAATYQQPKPSAAIPIQTAAPVTVAPPETEYKAFQPYGNSAATLHTRDQETAADSGVVTEVVRRPGELPMGTNLHARLRTTIDTQTTEKNTAFSALLSEDIRDNNRIVLPAGSIIEGQVTKIRGGKRIHGEALIHLQAQRIILPDNTSIPLQAQVVETDQYTETKIDNEGNILHKGHPGTTAATMTALTGGGAIAGALVGGGVGAVVGAGIGAGISTVLWLKQDRQAHLSQDTMLVFSLTDPMNLKQPDFALGPAAMSSAARPSATIAAVPEPAQPYTAPQAFVPTN